MSVPQVLKNVKVKVKKPLDEIEGLSEKVRSIKEMLGDKGRILVRPSGTEPKYRVMVEGEDRGFIEELAEEVADFIKQRLC
ncbi:Phosphoglucosamine mutase [Thermosulfurimonas dismutans]|uniref:Phosphoglucosamine mutase n=2 Tax=Thermosulfurimonas dismutans TaxID=999894 RepID=A0A179D185_9BACT|nr:Phosphoglucosamine mutase [Thermosulfurimonas dismutans]